MDYIHLVCIVFLKKGVCVCVCVSGYVHLSQVPTETRGTGSSGARVTGGYELPDMSAGELNSGLLEEKQMFLMTELSLHIQNYVVGKEETATFLFCFEARPHRCIPCWPETFYVYQSGLKFRLLGLKALPWLA